MKAYPHLRRVLALVAALLVFGPVLVAVALSNRPGEDNKPRDSVAADGKVWPIWGGSVARNMVNSFDKNIATEWSVEDGQEKHIKWSVDLGDRAYGGPIIADGKVFIGTNNKNPRNDRDRDKATKEPLDKGIVMCFRESDGKFLWQGVHDKLPAGRVNDWPEEGICSTPLVEGKRVYYVNNRAEVICADTEGMANGNDGVQDEKYKDKTDEDVIWRFDMIKKLNVFPHNLATSSPLIVGDLLFVVTSNGVDEGHIEIPEPAAPSFLCLNKKDGTPKWQSNLPSVKLVEARKENAEVSTKDLSNKGLILMHGQWSSPAYAEVHGKAQVVFPGGNGWLYAFEPDSGKLLWKFDCNPKNSYYELGGKGTRSDFIATPVVYENKLYLGVGQDPEHKEGVGHLWCVDLVKATDRGAKNEDHDVSPAGDNFDPDAAVNKNSALQWHFGGRRKEGGGNNPYVFGRTMSTCAVHDGLCYAIDLGGHLFCLDADSGKQHWAYDMKAPCWSSPYWVDGKVYLGNDNGALMIFKHGKDMNLLTTIDMGAGVRATPVAANGVLYVMTESPGKLYAIK
jgi:outer membrane protein assembly factor BamB